MMDMEAFRQRAIKLMREALELLGEAGEHMATNHLKMAIHVTEATLANKVSGALLDGDDDRLASPELPANPVLVRAIGGALAMIATVMAREGGTSVEEMARLLGVYAVVTREKSEDEGLILACWGAMLRDVVDAHRGEN